MKYYLRERAHSIKKRILALPWPSFIRTLLNHWLTEHFLRYLVIGLSTFALQIVFLFLLTKLTRLKDVEANLISTLLCLVFNFLMSNYWTFRSGSHGQGKKMGKYLIVAAWNYIFDTLLAFPFLTLTINMNPYIAKILITALIVLWNFFIYKFWVFKTSKAD